MASTSPGHVVGLPLAYWLYQQGLRRPDPVTACAWKDVTHFASEHQTVAETLNLAFDVNTLLSQEAREIQQAILNCLELLHANGSGAGALGEVLGCYAQDSSSYAIKVNDSLQPCRSTLEKHQCS